MKYIYLALLLITLAFAVPASIKTAYKNYTDDRIDLSMSVKSYNDTAVLITWKPESENDILGYEIQRHNEQGLFIAVGFVPALRGAKSINYHFIDYPATNDLQVYRLKKMTTDKSEFLSREATFKRKLF